MGANINKKTLNSKSKVRFLHILLHFSLIFVLLSAIIASFPKGNRNFDLEKSILQRTFLYTVFFRSGISHDDVLTPYRKITKTHLINHA